MVTSPSTLQDCDDSFAALRAFTFDIIASNKNAVQHLQELSVCKAPAEIVVLLAKIG